MKVITFAPRLFILSSFYLIFFLVWGVRGVRRKNCIWEYQYLYNFVHSDKRLKINVVFVWRQSLIPSNTKACTRSIKIDYRLKCTCTFLLGGILSDEDNTLWLILEAPLTKLDSKIWCHGKIFSLKFFSFGVFIFLRGNSNF